MVPVVDIACILAGRLEIKRIGVRWEARVDGRTPLPLHGYTGDRGAEDTAPGRRNTAGYPARLNMGIKPDGVACPNRCAIKVRLNG
jgi:hypothetical protein